MDRTSVEKNTSALLYPPLEPFDRRMIDMGDGHRVYVEQCGQPDGLPVVVLHGGPGGGCSPAMRRYFDPATYRIILFDQRGCGHSQPHAAVEANTTWHLVADIERIRTELGIDSWIVFGGSWGATLALIYAITNPDPVRHLVLRGVFLMTRAELNWFYGGGAGAFWPDRWAEFTNAIPEDEQGDLIAAYHRRLFSGDRLTETRFGRIWTRWENALAIHGGDGLVGEGPADYARAFARLENHYFTHGGWLDGDGWILNNRQRIAGIPADVVQGRYDMICPPRAAWELTDGWARAALHLIPTAGHAMSEPGISAELIRITNRLRR